MVGEEWGLAGGEYGTDKGSGKTLTVVGTEGTTGSFPRIGDRDEDTPWGYCRVGGVMGRATILSQMEEPVIE